MALRVWLPLNGNLNNNGLSNCAIVNNGATIDSNGKIGKTYSFDGNDDYISVNYPQSFNNNWTYCCWIYNDDSAGRSIFYGDFSLPNTGNISIEKTTSETVRFYWNNGQPDMYFSNSIITAGKWTHLALTYDGTTINVYINGVLTNSRNQVLTSVTKTGVYYIGRDGRTGGTAFKGKMNDFRLYDECLSQKQIKEISKGLVCHYKLDTPRALNNLKRNALYGTYNNYSSSGSTCTVVDTGTTYMGSKVYRMTYTPNDTSLSNVKTALGNHGVTTPGQTFKANTKYCYWTLCKPISHPDSVVGGIASNIGGWTEIPMKEYGNGWYIVGQSRNGTVTSDKTDTIFTSFKTPSATSGTPIIIDFCCPHLVEGYDYIVPEFDYAGTVVAQEKDVSGNGFTGTIYGTLTYNNDSPRYSGSTTFGSSNCLIIGRPMPKDALTVNAWAYMTDWSAYTGRIASCTEGGGWNFEPMSGAMNFALGVGASSNTYMTNFTTSQTPLSGITSGWHMFTGVFDGINKKIYIDGELKGSINTTQSGTTLTTATPIFYNANNSIFIGAEAGSSATTPVGQYFNGSLSDFRIYSTALSDDDILTLYKTSGIIDNKGNVYSYEFKEE